MSQLINRKLLEQLRKILRDRSKFPIGILTYFGPDNKTITKIVGLVIKGPDIEPRLRSWSQPGVVSDPIVVAEIGSYFLENKTVDIVMTGSVLGCPHEEGVDFPLGTDCPHCKYWSSQIKL